jgi:hypothetical protein
MANSVDDALNRASAEQRERAMQTIEEARRNIQSAQMQPGDMSSMDASNIAHSTQVIEDAKRTMPPEPVLRHVNEVSSPPPTPPVHGRVDTTPMELNAETHANIESIQQNGGNNYLDQNAVDRALERQPQETPDYEQQQRAMGR